MFFSKLIILFLVLKSGRKNENLAYLYLALGYDASLRI